ncbi:MAG: MbcA/ParS/Xre antitoxin family protein [Burkholderiaceae bacterium]|nr:MbcA/ParS/Xre antitoxin family protein [Burkholderiaceae bacterium]
MTAYTQDSSERPEAASVLGKAVVRAADRLDISHALLAKILGVSAATITRLYSGDYRLDQRRKEWELALLFVRVFRSLDSIVGNQQTARQWLASHNLALGSRPIDLLPTAEGLVRVVHYLDASRGLV